MVYAGLSYSRALEIQEGLANTATSDSHEMPAEVCPGESEAQYLSLTSSILKRTFPKANKGPARRRRQTW